MSTVVLLLHMDLDTYKGIWKQAFLISNLAQNSIQSKTQK